LLFTWDEIKAQINVKKHGVSFELAKRVFGDPFLIMNPDPYPYEERWQVIGMPFADKPTLLFVVYTEEDEDGTLHLISARRASVHERKAYENGKF
jgi:uncharacterized DUF497 family protein